MALTQVSLALLQPGYSPFAQRLYRPLASSQTFTPGYAVGLSTVGEVLPFSSGNITDIQYALGVLDPAVVYGDSSYVSETGDSIAVFSGVLTCANGTGDNELTQADVGAVVFTADGLTANATKTDDPVGDTTATGVPFGTFLGFDTDGNPLVSVIPEDLALSAQAAQDLVFTGDVPTNTTPTTGISATWGAQSGTTPGTYTQTSDGIVAAAGALVGGSIFDTSGNGGVIVHNTACTASSGVISIAGKGFGTPATATTLIVYPPSTPAGTIS